MKTQGVLVSKIWDNQLKNKLEGNYSVQMGVGT
jgi:hypothetical protein